MKSSTKFRILWILAILLTVCCLNAAVSLFVYAYTEVGSEKYFSLAFGLLFFGAFFFWFNEVYGRKKLLRKLKKKKEDKNANK